MQERKEKFRINQTSGRGNLLNMTMVCNTIYENRSMSMNKEKGGIIMDITMMTLIS